MTNYQGFDSFEEMMADRRENFSFAKGNLDIRVDIEYILTKLNFSRTKYTAIYAEWTNAEGFAVRLYSKGSMYEIYLPDKKKHSQGDFRKLLSNLEERLKREE